MFHLIITVDYELPAGGRGDVLRHMIVPTARLMDVCEEHGAKLTIMAEMAELWAFERDGNAGFAYHLGYEPGPRIRAQLEEAGRRGHDVQLHLHPQWINASWRSPSWDLDYAHYRLHDFTQQGMLDCLRRGKVDLETMLRPHCAGYECLGFRAGHWNTQPSRPYLAALRDAGLKSDTSVFKWGHRADGGVFDYRNAFSNVMAWYADAGDINEASSEPMVLEVPIATESVTFFRMLTPRRLRMIRNTVKEDREISRALSAARGNQLKSRSMLGRPQQLLHRSARKLDFCKLTARGMQSSIGALIRQCDGQPGNLHIPLVMIGHSKEAQNPQDLGAALKAVTRQFDGRLRFSSYGEFINLYTKQWQHDPELQPL